MQKSPPEAQQRLSQEAEFDFNCHLTYTAWNSRCGIKNLPRSQGEEQGKEIKKQEQPRTRRIAGRGYLLVSGAQSAATLASIFSIPPCLGFSRTTAILHCCLGCSEQ